LFSIGDWTVPVVDLDGQTKSAFLSEFSGVMSAELSSTLGFPWSHILSITDPDWQQVVKISYNDRIQGLIRYEMQPQPEVDHPDDIEGLNHQLLNVLHLETVQGAARIIEPLGQWLIWYAAKVALRYCSGTKKGIFLGLVAIPSAREYYRDKVGMSYDGSTKFPDGSDGYAFSFNQQQAVDFCRKHERKHGHPMQT
jgi:hypothetical protein